LNWLPRTEVANVLELAGFEVIKQTPEVLMTHNLGPISRWVNRWLTPLPLFRQFAVAIVTLARKIDQPHPDPSLSIIVPTRNEAGNIKRILSEIPRMSTNQELIFVEGNSTDDTWQVLQEQTSALPASYPYKVQVHKQTGIGKGDAVRLGFAKSTGEMLMILDADLTVPPSELPLFYDALVQQKAEFANGSRLVYPQETEAMRFLNYIANKLFGLWFSFIMGQPVRDTLCGTKVFWRDDYELIAANRAYFGELDPFGDFDLLFGAARLNLKIRDIPVHYKERTYGSTNIARFRHGLLLLRMSILGARKLVFASAPSEPPGPRKEP
jgi:glycosyltransferase involved in cell wall biosynthesis